MNDNRNLLENESVLESGQGSVVVPQPTPETSSNGEHLEEHIHIDTSQFGTSIEDPNGVDLNPHDLFKVQNDEPSTSSSQNDRKLGKKSLYTSKVN